MILDNFNFCNSFAFLLRIVSYLFSVLQWVIPIILIVLIVIDLSKALINPDEKTKKDAVSKAVKRVIYAVIIFFIPLLVKLIFRFIGDAKPRNLNGNVESVDLVSCFNEYFN